MTATAPKRSLAALFLDRIAESPDLAAFRVRERDAYVDVPWSAVAPRLERIAAGLLTALDLADDAHVTILGNTSLDWVLCDMAALSVGLRTVPVYASLLPAEVGYMHVDSGAVVAIVADAVQLAKLRAIRDGFAFMGREYGPDPIPLRHIVVLDPAGIEPAADWESLETLERRGAAHLAALGDELARRRARIERHHTATYTYTSGTTGAPKAVIQTHGNMLAMLEAAEQVGMFSEEVREGGLFLFMPLAHSFGRFIELAGPYFGSPLVLSSVPTLVEDLGLAAPGFFPSAPRVYEKMMAKVESAVAAAPPLRQRLFHWAVGVGRQTLPFRSRGEPLPRWLAMRHRVADALVLSKLRARLGLHRTALALSGSAPLSVDVHTFFLALGVPLVEAYGLTETCPGLTTNLPDDFQVGSVGKPFPGVQIRIAEDGEILARGPNITSGYRNRPDATAGAFDADGWFRTGDLGAVDARGFLTITGRKKELIKTSFGKFVAPAKIEGKLKTLPMIQEAVLVGDKRNYCACLISLDPEELAAWTAVHDGDARQAVQDHVDAVNAQLASFETVKRFALLPQPLTVDNGMLTASLKVKRDVVQRTYAHLVDAMYAAPKVA